MTGDDPMLPLDSDAAASLLDDLSGAFERLWTTEERARIEDFLARVPKELRPQLLERLLRLELALQSRSGETIAVLDYRKQFSDYREIVDSVLAELSTQRCADATQTHVSTLGLEGMNEANTQAAPTPFRSRSRSGKEHAAQSGTGGNRIGDYEIIDEIARGGMGVVFKARQLKLNRVVALKMILAGQFASQDDVLRFYSEAEAAARLDHPGIVPIYEVDEFEGKHFFSMGFVDGESLQQRVAHGPLPQREAAGLLLQVAQAVHYAHQQGIVHRDLKPRNILVTTDGHAKVTDFGLAKCIEEDSGLTVSGQILGTPGYMPPEQATGKLEEIGPRADVYALGAVLYCLLTGRPPFQSATAVETIKQVLESPPASPRVLNPAIDRDLETICLKCLEKHPDHRYHSASDVADELQRYLSGEPIRARPVGPVVRTARWLRRRPLVVAIGSLLLLLAIIAPATVMVGLRTLEARRVAELQHKLDAGLDSPQLTAAWLEEMDAHLNELARRNPELASEDRQRLNKAFAERIRQESLRPRIDEELVASLLGSVDLLRPRDKELADILRTELTSRQRDWQQLFVIQSPFQNAADVFDPGDFQYQEGRLTPRVADRNPLRRALTRIPSGGLVQLEARFEEQWEHSSRIGLSLRADVMQGYDFLLLADDARTLREDLPASGDVPKQLTFGLLRERQAYFTLAIYRNGVQLIREQVPATEIPAGPLVIRATCEQAELRLEAGPVRAVSFRDPFPIPARQSGTFAVHWPREVGLLHLEARSKPKPLAVSPLERGDELYEQGEYAQALEQYRQQAIEASDMDFQQEARYKQALCLLQLKRLDDASTLLDAVKDGEGERWPPIAGCQLWLIRLEQKRHTEADSVFDYLSTRFSFGQVASLIPQELRQEILASYHSDLESISTVMRFNPDLMLRMRRLAAVDRFLSADGRGRELTQIEVSRGYHLLGDLPSALEAAEQLASGSANATLQRHYLRLLRLNDDAERALHELNEYHKRHSDRREPEQDHLMLERARIYAALNRWQECEQALDHFALAHRGAKRFNPATFTYYAMMKGTLLNRRGATGPALAVWRQAYEGMRGELQRARGPNSEVVNAVILGSLCGDLTDEECHQFFTGVVNRGGDNAIARQAQTIIGPALTASSLRNMWRSPLGRKCAEDFAFERLSLRDRVKIPVVLLATEYFNQSVFQGEMTDEQRQAVFDVVAGAFDETIYDGTLTISHVAQIILTWKGTANFLGWDGAAPTLSARTRGGLAYVMAHRYLKLGDQARVVTFLDTAIKEYPPGSPISTLATRDKQLLAGKSGRLVVVTELSDPVRLLVHQSDKEVATVNVMNTQEIDVPAGELKLSLAAPRDDYVLSQASVSMTSMGRRHIQLRWLWKPVADAQPLPGLIPQPAVNAVGARWQMAFRHPVQETRGLAFNHDGTRLVAGSDDGLLRIYDVRSHQLLGILSPAPRFLRDVIWAPSPDRIVAGGRDHWIRGWNSADGEMWFERNDAGVVEGLARGDGSQFASCSPHHEAMGVVWTTEGVPVSTWSRPDYGSRDVALSPNGKWLATVPTLPAKSHILELTELATGRVQQLVGTQGRAYARPAFSPDNRYLGAGANTQELRLWQTSDWQTAATISLPGGNVSDLLWTSDSQRLLVGIMNKEIVEFDATQSPPVEVKRHPAPGLARCALSPDGSTLATAHFSRSLSLVNRADSVRTPWGQDDREQLSVTVRPTAGREIAVVGQDGVLRLLDAQGHVTATVPMERRFRMTSVAWSPDGNSLAASVSNGSVAIYNADGKLQRQLNVEVQDHDAPLAWTRESKLAVVTRNRQLRIVEPVDGSVLSTLGTADARQIALDPVTLTTAVSTAAGDVELQNLPSAEKSRFAIGSHTAESLAVSPQGTRTAILNGAGVVSLWLPDGEKIADLPNAQGNSLALAWSPSGRVLATCKVGGEVQLWSDDGKLQETLPAPLSARTNALAWIDDDRLVTTGEDASVRIWKVSAKRPETVTLFLSNQQWACFSASGRLLQSSALIEDELVYMLETPRAALQVLRPSQFDQRVKSSSASAKPAEPRPVLPQLMPMESAASKEAEVLPTKELAILHDPAILESSGLAANSRSDAVWTHNDDEKFPRLYLVGRNGETLGRFDLEGVKPFDWEDMCSFHRDGTSYLLIGDMGDNRAARTDCRLLLVSEPELSQEVNRVVDVPVAATIPFQYEDGPHDCEALAVDVERNVALLITKELDETCILYEVPLDHRGDKPAVAKRARELKLPLVTAMDISPDGRRLVVLGGLHAFEWTRRDKESWAAALDRLPRRYVLPRAKQAEAIAYRRDGKALLLTSEGENQPLWEMTLRD